MTDLTSKPNRAFARSLLQFAVALAVLMCAGGAVAQDRRLKLDTMIQGGDYDQFQVPGLRGGRACAEACANDPRCQAWTFIRPVGQCRIKFEAGPAVPNKCCISGMKPTAEVADIGGKQGYCADYARRGVAASNQNLSQGCRLAGARWGGDFQAHYNWCMSVERARAQSETDTRAADLARCTTSASDGADAKCDHYARVSAVQIATAKKANCTIASYDRLWTGDVATLKANCQRAPSRLLPADIDRRESILAACFGSVGQLEQACGGYVETALKQVSQASANECGFVGRSWTSSRAQHLQWCLDAGPAARKAETDARGQQIAACTQQAARRAACDQYAQNATQQAVNNESQNCGFSGANWSRYQDDHVTFCMQASDTQLRSETANRTAALQQCQSRNYVSPECDEYAKRAVRLSRMNVERACENEGELWSPNYADHYQFCSQSNPQERRDTMMLRRQAMHACSDDHGFRLELGF